MSGCRAVWIATPYCSPKTSRLRNSGTMLPGRVTRLCTRSTASSLGPVAKPKPARTQAAASHATGGQNPSARASTTFDKPRAMKAIGMIIKRQTRVMRVRVACIPCQTRNANKTKTHAGVFFSISSESVIGCSTSSGHVVWTVATPVPTTAYRLPGVSRQLLKRQCCVLLRRGQVRHNTRQLDRLRRDRQRARTRWQPDDRARSLADCLSLRAGVMTNQFTPQPVRLRVLA